MSLHDDAFGSCLICEDVRQELNGQMSIVGVFPPFCKVENFPINIPRLFFVTHLKVKSKEFAETVSFIIREDFGDKSDKTVVSLTSGANMMEELPEENRFICRAIFMAAEGLKVPSQGKISLSLVSSQYSNKEIELGSLVFEEASDN